MQPRRVNFHTLGCKLNFSESSTLAREFERGGFVRVAPTAEADICVLYSCSVTEHADTKCRNLIRKPHRRNPAAIIAVTGRPIEDSSCPADQHWPTRADVLGRGDGAIPPDEMRILTRDAAATRWGWAWWD